MSATDATNVALQDGAADALAAVRRLDGRFLLASPALGRVAWLGPSDSLAEVLARFADCVCCDDAEPACPLVVARNPDAQTVARAAKRVAPGGCLYFELDRGGGLAVLREQLAALGFRELRAYWHWPNFDRCAEIVPLDSPAALRCFFGRRRADALARLKAAVGSGLARIGAAARLARCVSVVASRSPWPETDPFLLVTPRFHASSHVLRLMLDAASGELRSVVKSPRLPGHSASLLHEAEMLATVHAEHREPVAGVPRRLALRETETGPSLTQSALLGRPLGPGDVGRRLAQTTSAVIDWLAAIQPRRAVWSDDDPTWYDRLVLDPLRTLDVLAPDAGDADRLAQTARLADELRSLRFPLVLEHGDLSPPNLLALDQGGVGAVDWELAEPHGLPAADLFFFLSFAAFARGNAVRSDRFAAAYDAALFGRRAWAGTYVKQYAERFSLPSAALAPLAVLVWARYLASLVRRSTVAPGAAAATAAWLRTNRYYALWQHTLHERGRLCWLVRP